LIAGGRFYKGVYYDSGGGSSYHPSLKTCTPFYHNPRSKTNTHCSRNTTSGAAFSRMFNDLSSAYECMGRCHGNDYGEALKTNNVIGRFYGSMGHFVLFVPMCWLGY
jgi:hypothetical protein